MTVDDSRSVRSIVSKQLLGCGFEVEEAEDGKQALERLATHEVDLILLDVTMPVMDGPTMLSALRAAGNKTPVVMLTSEARSSVIAEAMRHGIDGYILKPFEPSEMMVKVRKALKLSDVQAAAVEKGALEAAQGATASPKQSSDVLVVDDMENVIKRVKALMPSDVAVEGVLTAQAALQVCREKAFKVVLIDYDLKGVNGELLASQIRILQPTAPLVAMAVRTPEAAKLTEQAKSQGFADVLLKPFQSEAFEDFVLQHFDRQDTIKRDENVLTLAAYIGKPERVERYFARVQSLIGAQLDMVAAACFEGVVIDLSRAPAAPERLPKLLVELCRRSKGTGLKVALVGSPEISKVLKMFEETKSVPFFADLEQAKKEIG
jgi:CheY-like chemotaxis protein